MNCFRTTIEVVEAPDSDVIVVWLREETRRELLRDVLKGQMPTLALT